MKWLNRFLIFLLIVVVAISLGLSIYYFLRNNEVFSFGAEDGQSITRYVNIGEPFDITVNRKNPSSDGYDLKSLDENIVEFVKKVDNDVFRFKAKSGGKTTIQLITSNSAYKSLNVTVYVGDGSEENPFFVRNYQDLKVIGTGDIEGRSLSANYRQVADIDMSVATAAWTPIGNNSTEGFTGKYDGNGHTISNLTLLKTGSMYATESSLLLDDSITKAGLFSMIGNSGIVSRLNLTKVLIDGSYAGAGAVACECRGQINFVNVTDSIISSQVTNLASGTSIVVGGIVGLLNSTGSQENSSFTARVQYSSINKSLVSADADSSVLGGLVGVVDGGMVYNSFVIADFALKNYSECMLGGLVGMANNDGVQNSDRVAIVNNYTKISTLSNTAKDGALSFMGTILGANIYQNNLSAPELKPLIGNELASRILGNFSEDFKIDETTFVTIGGIPNVTDAYLAYSQSAENMKKKPTTEQIDAINQAVSIDANLAYVGYDVQGFFASWDFDKVWDIQSSVNDGYPFIRDNAIAVSDAIYDEFGSRYIDSEVKLKTAFAQDLADDNEYNGKYYISNDIYLTTEWTPIGTEEKPFNGQFIAIPDEDGNMPSIYNLIISSAYDCVGFFGCIGSAGVVQDITINGVKITSNTTNAGVIAGINKGQIIKCTVKSNADTEFVGINLTKSDGNKNLYIGGIAGKMTANSIMQDCFASLNLIVNSQASGSVYIGGIVGLCYSDISNCSYDGIKNDFDFAYELKITSSTTLNAVIGGIVGNLESNGLVSNSKATSKIVAPNSEGSIVGGVVGQLLNGYNADKFVFDCASINSNITGYLAGGIAGVVNVTTKDFTAINKCYSTGSIFGSRVGGIASEIKNGTITNCYADCKLSGKVMAGFAVEIALNGNGSYGKVAYCFSNCSFVKSSGTAYAETESEVRALNFWLDKSTKVAGYVENCIYNEDRADGANRRYGTKLGPWAANPDDGNTSENDCKKMSVFVNRGFDSTIWSFGTDENPRFPTFV